MLQKIQLDLDELDAQDAHRPSQFVVAIGRPRDAGLTADLHRLSTERLNAGRCPLLPLFWDDLLGDLFSNEHAARKHFPELYAPGSSQPHFSDDDLSLLAALNEHDVAEPETWMSSFEVAVRTRLSPRDLNDTITILTESGYVESHPFAAGQKGGSPFAYQRIRISAKGRRAIKTGTHQVVLAGPILPPSVNVSLDYPNKNVELVLREQRGGFSVAWEHETLLVDRAEPFEPVVEEVGLRPSRLQVLDGPGMLLLVRKPLRTIGEDEARGLIKKHFPGAAYLENKNNRWFANESNRCPRRKGGPQCGRLRERSGKGTRSSNF